MQKRFQFTFFAKGRCHAIVSSILTAFCAVRVSSHRGPDRSPNHRQSQGWQDRLRSGRRPEHRSRRDGDSPALLAHQYADKPQVGKVFQVRGTNSVAVFFTLTKRNQGDMKIAGLLIAARTPANHVEAAVVSDEASRFGTTVNPMLGTLFNQWHPEGSAEPQQ